MQLWILPNVSKMGVHGIDDVDGDVTANVTVEGNVDINTEGDYTLTYKVKDSTGFIKFYTKGEWSDICSRQGLVIADSFDSSIRFPKKKDTAYGYEEVLGKHDNAVIDSYDLVETDTELYITEQVNNILFEKN